MTRIKSCLALILAGVLFLSAWGCQKSPADTTELPTATLTEASTTEPAPTVSPTTAPLITEVPTEAPTVPITSKPEEKFPTDSPFPTSFTKKSDDLESSYSTYEYTGTEAEIPLDEAGITLHIPERWQGKVKITSGYCWYNGEITLDIWTSAIPEALAARGYSYPYKNMCIMNIVGLFAKDRTRKEAECSYMGDHMNDYFNYMGTTESYYFYYRTQDMPEPTDTGVSRLTEYIEEIGRETFNEIADGFICTPEVAAEVITFN